MTAQHGGKQSKQGVKWADVTRAQKAKKKRTHKKLTTTQSPNICAVCSRDCRSRSGLLSHNRWCNNTKWSIHYSRQNSHSHPRLNAANDDVILYDSLGVDVPILFRSDFSTQLIPVLGPLWAVHGQRILKSTVSKLDLYESLLATWELFFTCWWVWPHIVVFGAYVKNCLAWVNRAHNSECWTITW